MQPKTRSLKLPPGPMPAAFRRQPPAARPIQIETPNYRLRSLTADDAGPQLQRWLSDDDMLRGANLPKVDWNMERLRGFIAAYYNRERYAIGVYRKGDDEPIGLFTIDVNLQHRRGMLTTALIDRAHWGTDVVHETILDLMQHMLQHRGLDKLSVGILATNRRMIYHLMRAPLFPFEGRLRQEVLTPDGNRVDLLIFAAYKTEAG